MKACWAVIAVALASVCLMCAYAQQLPRYEFPLWDNGAPGALGKEAKDIPTLTPFFAPPAKATGAAIIICPGGSYGALDIFCYR